jgi:hypothetical protein
LARRKKKQPLAEGVNIMTNEFNEWKKGDCSWYRTHRGDWRFGEIVYFSENPVTGKKWVTLWDLVEPRFESSDLDSLHLVPPISGITDRACKRVAAKQRLQKKHKNPGV